MTFEGLLKRQNEIPLVKNIISEEGDKFIEWFYHRKASPIIEGILEWLCKKQKTKN